MGTSTKVIPGLYFFFSSSSNVFINENYLLDTEEKKKGIFFCHKVIHLYPWKEKAAVSILDIF
jgi:hypothetical protein